MDDTPNFGLALHNCESEIDLGAEATSLKDIAECNLMVFGIDTGQTVRCRYGAYSENMAIAVSTHKGNFVLAYNEEVDVKTSTLQLGIPVSLLENTNIEVNTPVDVIRTIHAMIHSI